MGFQNEDKHLSQKYGWVWAEPLHISEIDVWAHFDFSTNANPKEGLVLTAYQESSFLLLGLYGYRLPGHSLGGLPEIYHGASQDGLLR